MSTQLSPLGDPSAHAPAAFDPADLAPDLVPETQARFVETLAQWGNVRAAARQVGVSRAHLYRMRRASEEFRQMWDAALLLARPQVEEVLADRALNGVTEAVFYHGEEVATRTRYDARLLLAHLGRLDRLGMRGEVMQAARDFELRLERLRNPPPADVWDAYEAEDEDEDDDWLYADGPEDGDDGDDDDYRDDGADDADDDGEDDGAGASEGDPQGSAGRNGAVQGRGDFHPLDSVSCVSNNPAPPAPPVGERGWWRRDDGGGDAGGGGVGGGGPGGGDAGGGGSGGGGVS